MKSASAHLLLLALLAPLASHANPLAGGDPVKGKILVQQHCISCHAASFGGDGSAIYTREDRRIKTLKGLLQQVRNCNTNIGLQWFEEDELHVAAYLNQTYYKLAN